MAQRRFNINNIYLGLGIGLFILLLSATDILDNFEAQTLDYRFLLRGKTAVAPQIKIIEIDDESIIQFGRWPWPRGYFGGFLRILSEYSPKVVGFDILFSEEDIEHPEYDDLMAGETGNLGNVYYAMYFSVGGQPFKFSEVSQGLDSQLQIKLEEFSIMKAEKKKEPRYINAVDTTVPIPKLLDRTSGIGFANMPAQKDGKVRTVPLVIRYKDRIYPSFSLAVLCGYLGCRLSDIEIKNRAIVIKSADNVIRIPTDRYGNMLINYTGDFNIFNRSSFYEIAAIYDKTKETDTPDNRLSDLKDKLILIGMTATGSTDLRPTSFSSAYPGIGIHANIINNILQNRFLYRVDWHIRAIILLFLGLFISLLIPKKRPLVSIGVLLGALFGYIFLALILFIFGDIWIDIVGPLSCILLSYTAVVFNQFTQERFQKQLIENELKIASQIQQSLLPKTIPSKKGIQIAAKTISAKHVGGDLYDVVDLGDDKIGIMIGDVSGKGVPAAIYMARTVGEFRSRSSLYQSPSKMLSVLNDILSKEGLSNMFVTVLYIIVDLSDKKFIFSNGGHNAILYKENQKDEFKTLDTKEGAPLGAIDGIGFSDEVVSFNTGDLAILFTDGINEARNRAKLEFGTERLEKFIIENSDLEPQRLSDVIIENVKQFSKGLPQHDDMTLIIIKFKD